MTYTMDEMLAMKRSIVVKHQKIILFQTFIIIGLLGVIVWQFHNINILLDSINYLLDKRL